MLVLPDNGGRCLSFAAIQQLIFVSRVFRRREFWCRLGFRRCRRRSGRRGMRTLLSVGGERSQRQNRGQKKLYRKAINPRMRGECNHEALQLASRPYKSDVTAFCRVSFGIRVRDDGDDGTDGTFPWTCPTLSCDAAIRKRFVCPLATRPHTMRLYRIGHPDSGRSVGFACNVMINLHSLSGQWNASGCLKERVGDASNRYSPFST